MVEQSWTEPVTIGPYTIRVLVRRGRTVGARWINASVTPLQIDIDGPAGRSRYDIGAVEQ